MDEADARELLAVFLLDAPGRIARIELQLERLERGGRPAGHDEAAAAAAHHAHSLRGAAGSLRLEPLAELAEELELTLADRGAATGGRARALVDRVRAELAELEAAAPPAAADPALRTVLHVEDNPVNARLIERVLARRPEVRLVTAAGVESGLRLAAAVRPELVLLDLHLADGSGVEFLARLREDPASRAARVVVVTGDVQPADGDALSRLGVDEYLTKPVDVGRLLELVDEAPPDAADGRPR